MEKLKLLILVVISVILTINLFSKRFERHWNTSSDLGISYLHSKAIKNFENPYKVMPEFMRKNEKYPPYFPLSYIIVAFVDYLGEFTRFEHFAQIWTKIAYFNNYFTDFILGYFFSVIFKNLKVKFSPLIGYSLAISIITQRLIFKKSVEQFDAFAFDLTLWSLFFLIFKRYYLGGLFLGLGLSFKQSFIFLIPVIFYYIFRFESPRSAFKFIGSFAITCSIIFLPFLFSGAYETIDATIIFHLTRDAIRSFLGYYIPYSSFIFPSFVKLSVILYLVTLYISITYKARPLITFTLVPASFLLFHKYPLEQYIVTLLYCSL
ncbi:MAG: hypothetical protein NZO16_02610, partial [Deltaproteobacteria bacterium]|nr:hypothetical protein [Deltaproteobacteria bacterium]